MFTDRLNLLSNKNSNRLQDQILLLTGMTWDDYENITQQDFNYRGLEESPLTIEADFIEQLN